MENLFHQSSMIKEKARMLGFDGCGITRVKTLKEDGVYLKDWLKHRYHARMSYLEKHTDKRINPAGLLEDARSVISVLLNYYPDKQQTDPQAPVLAKYAYGKDYHKIFRKKLEHLMHHIRSDIAPVNGRIFVDSAPVLQKAWAARAGLGWIGKNTCLVSPQNGSFCFIGTLIVDLPLHYDEAIAASCGDCTLCMEACPTQAIVAPHVLDAGRCIAYLTIENRSDIPREFEGRFAGRVFGCDICQDVCPWNRGIVAHRMKDFEPLPALLEMNRADWYRMNEETFNRLFANSAVKRAKFKGLQRNLEFIAR
jgi:epoxyqueuosine reductase